MAVQIYGREIHWGFLNPGILKSLNHKWQKVEYAARKQHGPLAPVSWKQPFSAAQDGSFRTVVAQTFVILGTVGSIPSDFYYLKLFLQGSSSMGRRRNQQLTSQVSADAASHSTRHSRATSVLSPTCTVRWQNTTHTHTPGCALTLHAITRVQITHSNSYSENQCYNIPTRTVQDQSTPISSKAFWAISAGLRATRNSEMRSQPLSPCKQKMREELFTDRMLRYKHRFNKNFHFSEF